jgi:hypothetical protein
MDDRELLEVTNEFFAEQGGDPVSLERADKEMGRAEMSSPSRPEPVDLYQRDQDRIREVNKKFFPKGSSQAVGMSTYAVIDGVGAEGLAKAWKKAKCDIEALKEKGERGRAEVRRQQYMQEDFLPAVEIVVNSTSPDEVLNSKRALDELDKYALLEGAGKGYTATYIRQAYGNQLGQQEGRSDASVRSDVMRLNSMLDRGEVRSALGLATKIKDKIDRGEAQADDLDYELIGRVVAYFN